MVLIDSIKYACATCIKGHRSSTCNHESRPLIEIKKKGRPVTQCLHCRELRKTKQVHVKCLCEGRPETTSSAPRTVILTPNATAQPSTIVTIVAPQASAQNLEPSCDCKTAGGSCVNCCTPRHQRRAPPPPLPVGVHHPSSSFSDSHPTISLHTSHNRASPSSSSSGNDEDHVIVGNGATNTHTSNISTHVPIKPGLSRSSTSGSHSSTAHAAALITAKRERDREAALGHEVGNCSIAQRSASSLHGPSGTNSPHPHPHPFHHHIPLYAPYQIHHHHPHHPHRNATPPKSEDSTMIISTTDNATFPNMTALAADNNSVFIDEDQKQPFYATSMSTLEDGTMTVLRRNRGRSSSTSHHEDISRPFPPPPTTIPDSTNADGSRSSSSNSINNVTSNRDGTGGASTGAITPFYMNPMAAASLPDVLNWPANLQSIQHPHPQLRYPPTLLPGDTGASAGTGTSSDVFSFMPSASANAVFESFMANPFQQQQTGNDASVTPPDVNDGASPGGIMNMDTSPFDDAETFAALQQQQSTYGTIEGTGLTPQLQSASAAGGSFQYELPDFRFDGNGEELVVQAQSQGQPSPNEFEQEFDSLAAYGLPGQGQGVAGTPEYEVMFLGTANTNPNTAPGQGQGQMQIAPAPSMTSSSRPPSMTASATSRSSSRASEPSGPGMQAFDFLDLSTSAVAGAPSGDMNGDVSSFDASSTMTGSGFLQRGRSERQGQNYVRYSLPASLHASAISLPSALNLNGTGGPGFPSNIADPFENDSTAIAAFDASVPMNSFTSMDSTVSAATGGRSSSLEGIIDGPSPPMYDANSMLGVVAVKPEPANDDGSGTAFPALAPPPSSTTSSSWSSMTKTESPSALIGMGIGLGYGGGLQFPVPFGGYNQGSSSAKSASNDAHSQMDYTDSSTQNQQQLHQYYSPPPGPPPSHVAPPSSVSAGGRTFESSTRMGMGSGGRWTMM